MSKPVVFMYSGQGSQYYGMGRPLFEKEPVFGEWLHRLDQAASAMLGSSVLDVVYDRNHSGSFTRTLYTHPAIYMIEIALTKLVESRGIVPDYVLGESLGEFAAAAAAGFIGWEDGMEMVIEQAKLLESGCAGGGMLAVLHETGSSAEIPSSLGQLELAARLSEGHYVLSGLEEDVRSMAGYLRRSHVVHDRLPVSHAFHSRYIDDAAQAYQRYLSGKSFQTGRVPIVSGLDGSLLQELPGAYFWNVIRQPIALRDSLATVESLGPAFLIDLGPSGGMAGMVKRRPHSNSVLEAMSILTRFGQETAGWDRRIQDLSISIQATKSMAIKKEVGPMKAFVFPGQGSQHRGMGEGLFDKYPDLTAQADRILGYSIKELCLEDPESLLGQTQYTQPALYVVNALHYLEEVEKSGPPDVAAGHSLGEYSALFASGAFDFETGLKLVKQRGELMSGASGGGMAAVIGLAEKRLTEVLSDRGLDLIDIANYNSLSQIVISGPQSDIPLAQEALEQAGARMVIPLKVSGAFHSRMMNDAAERFAVFLDGFHFGPTSYPVIANVTARPYRPQQLKPLLASQITHSVQWTDTIRYMMGLGVEDYKEIGPGNVLTKLIASIRKEALPLQIQQEAVDHAEEPPGLPEEAAAEDSIGMTLGDAEFKRDYGLKYAYIAGAMYKGIASEAMVVRAGKAGILGVYGAGGLSPDRIEEALCSIKEQLPNGEPYGFNLLHDPDRPDREEQLVDLYLKYGVRVVEASAYMGVNAALVRYRADGLRRLPDGSVTADNRVIAKISRPEVAEAFLNPAPHRIVMKLLQEGIISPEVAEWLQRVPVADDISVEADSGGHTDHRSPYTLLPTIIRLRDTIMNRFRYDKRIRVGAAGGIGTPEAALAAYAMGADYIVTGSINQCTVEAGTSDAVKDLLQQADIQDMDYAPAGDMFELGSKVQVLKKGGFFSARANRLYEIYRNYDSVEQIDIGTRRMIEEKFFGKSFEEVYGEVQAYKPPGELERAERDPKFKMALIFKWYLAMTNLAAIKGDPKQRVNYQIHCGPALGAFNQWVKGSAMEDWRQRHVDDIARQLCDETAGLLQRRFLQLAT
ncbi:ACP S-malonyltransferase [Paenibacillus caseinilyticus]|uniref:ACP S-malonyltransferase n=1 Tax=Paenibacillus caseinilyticus TaxID=3098138 RepID=UPI0022B8BEAB|nr:ACP S-malonyltransferase [Paenibacillus caseinilyticus]MCZ8522704.1 ACP S-malonyltransferase [Paenibacillus caseinilyticus]